MSPHELFREGKLAEAIQSLGAELRDRPTDSHHRTFLFELLCFAGEFNRASKHLNILSTPGTPTETGALLYRSALAAERKRQLFFQTKAWQEGGACPPCPGGTINGRRFQTLRDADSRIGSRLEVFIAGEYIWLPFAHLGNVGIEAPKYLRDLLWATGHVLAGPNLEGREMGEVLLPVLTPAAFQHPDDAVRLGRITDWETVDGLEVPAGQKLLVIDEATDDEEWIPILEVRELVFDETDPTA